MKAIMPFWELGLIDRYTPQFHALADVLERLDIVYISGEVPENFHPKIRFIKFTLPAGFHKYLIWLKATRTIHEIMPNDCDIVYSLSGLWFNILGQKMAEAADIPHVIRLRGDMTTVRMYQRKGLFQRYLFQATHEQALRDADLVFPIVKKYIPYLQGLGATIGEIIPNGIIVDDRAAAYPETFSPAYIGRVSKEKGSEFLLELIKATPEYTWRITGDIQDHDFIPPKNCHYLGWTPYERIKEFYDQSSVIVLPSHAEGFPNAILEAYANGKPIIGTPDAIPVEVDVIGARLSLDLQLWVQALNELEGCRPNQILSNRMKAVARSYSWENYGLGIKRQLEKAISSRVH